MSDFPGFLKDLVEGGGTLTVEQACSAVSEMLSGGVGDIEIAALLTAIASRGATAEELAGFVQAMRSLCQPIPLAEAERAALVDTCGTGGDGRGSFNISTGAALVAAAAGAKVAKHGNRKLTSRCGSADVLEALGVPIELDPEDAAECLRRTGFMFLYAPRMHPAMKRVQTVRKALGFRTIFNLAGPLTNPAGAQAQVIGVFAAECVAVVSEAMVKLHVRHALVVHGSDGLDELTLSGESQVAEVRDHTVKLFRIDARSAGLDPAPESSICGGDAQENSAILERILAGARGPQRDIVLLNAAAALVVAGLAADLREGVERGAEAVDSGRGRRLLEGLRQFRGEVHPKIP